MNTPSFPAMLFRRQTYQVNVPMLHCMRHIRRLNDVFEDNHRPAVHVFLCIGNVLGIVEGQIPSIIAERLQFLIKYIGRQNGMDNKRSETLLVFHVAIDTAA